MMPNAMVAQTLPPKTLLDTQRTVETPEGIALDLRVAGPVVRALAWLLDSLLKYSVLIACLMGLAYLGSTGFGLWLLGFFLLEWFYPVFFEVYRDGATPGKRVLGLKVVSDNGAPVDFSASLIRNLLRAADFMPVLYGFGLVSMLLNRDFKRLGDLAAATIVIYRERSAVFSQADLPQGPQRQPNTPLSPAEQRLIINFAERSARLSDDRQNELAALLPALAENRDHLLAQARWSLGSQG